MQLIPDYLDWFPSGAERTIHELLSECHDLNGYALHSLNVAKHRTKIWGEIDFILIRPFGVVALEVKGGELFREGGRWGQRDVRNGRERWIENPIDQVRNSVFPVVNDLRENGVKVRAFGWGFVTPECDMLPETPEYPSELQADYFACQDASCFRKWLLNLEEYWKAYSGRKNRDLKSFEIEKLRRALRPDCDLAVSLGKRVKVATEKMKRFTEEQYKRLDEISENDRILCRGAAGTGKTFLAMEVMRRETALGNTCLYVARSKNLVKFLRQGRENLDIQSYDEICHEEGQKGYDVLVVDEGQDLLGLNFLAVLDGTLKGGLGNGRWRWFMDDYHQAGFHDDVDPEAIHVLNTKGVTLQRLNVNCRNTKEIASFTQLATGADIGEAKLHGAGPRAEYPIIPKGHEKKSLLLRIKKWIDNDVAPQEIVVLTCSDCVDPELGGALPKHVRMLTIREYKGLEADCVCVVGLAAEPQLETLVTHLYTGLTRARVAIWLAIPESMRSSWNEMTANNLEKMMGVSLD